MTLFLQKMGYFFWDPDRVFFTLPFLRYPITWYGTLFALAFFIGYFIVKWIFKQFLLSNDEVKEKVNESATFLADKLTTYCVIATVVGARIGHLLFYDFYSFIHSPWIFFKVWEGGLASHGAAVGLFMAIFIFAHLSRKNFPYLTKIAVLEIVMVPSAIIGAFIRVGNFINQEILGRPTTLKFGVLFGHPLQKAPFTPLHPVQLYEALFYFLFGISLLLMVKRKIRIIGKRVIASLFFILIFGFRFFVEFLKLPQSDLYDESHFLSMGQLLSLPFIAIGFYLLFRAWRKEIKLRDIF